MKFENKIASRNIVCLILCKFFQMMYIKNKERMIFNFLIVHKQEEEEVSLCKELIILTLNQANENSLILFLFIALYDSCFYNRIINFLRVWSVMMTRLYKIQ